MRVAVTGSTGYVGTRLLARLMRDGHILSALVEPGTPPPRCDGQVRAVVGDVMDSAPLRRLMRGADVVFHCAGRLPTEWPHSLYRVNVEGAARVCAACEAENVERLVAVSSVAVYRPWARRSPPVSEHRPIRAPLPPARLPGLGASPRDPAVRRFAWYADTKVRAEHAYVALEGRRTVDTVILRPTEVYGPRRPWFDDLLRRLRNDPAQVLARTPVDRVLQWVQVDDLVDAMAAAASLESRGVRVFNLAGDEVFSVRDVVAAVARGAGLLPPDPTGAARPPRAGAAEGAAIYDTTRAGRELGFRPRGGILRTIDTLLRPAPDGLTARAARPGHG